MRAFFSLNKTRHFMFLFSHKKELTTPMIRQHEYTECGLACLAMLLGHYGHHASLSQLRRQHSVSEEAGTSLFDLLNWSTGYGFTGRVLQGTFAELTEIRLPAIAFWRGHHFVVITHFSAKQVTVHDPASGVRHYRHREAAALFSGYVLELQPGPVFIRQEAQPEQTLRLGALSGLIGHLHRRQLALLLFSLFCLLLMLISPSYLQLVVDEAVARNDYDLVILLTLVFAIVFVFDVASRLLKQILEICMRNFAYDDLSQTVRSLLLRAHPSWFRTRPSGIILAVEKSLHACAEFISNGYIAMLSSALMALCSLVFMLFYNLQIAMITLVSMALFFMLRFMLIGPWQRAVDRSILKTAEYESLLVETQKGIITLKANNMEANLSQVLEVAMRQHIAALIKKERLLARFDATSLAVINIEQLIVVGYGAWSVMQGSMTLGMLFAYLSYKRYFADGVMQIAQKLLEKSSLRGPLERLADLIHYPQEAERFGDLPLGPVANIEFDDVSFSWPAKAATLKNLSLCLKREQETVIIGRSGSGKTTFLRLICGMLNHSSGEIRINQRPVTDWQLSSLRERIRIVHADDTLFTGTLAENVASFAAEIDHPRVRSACRLAEIDTIVDALPHGYETPFVPGSPFFSAGEVQRLVLARALYSKPDWLLCDEVTANLDKVTAQRVLANLRGSGIGLVLVTHSPERVYQQGQLLSLENGSLAAVDAAEVLA